MAAQQTNMEEILTSIRTTLAEETAKVASPSAVPAGLDEISDEEVLALSEEDVAAPGEGVPAASAADEMVDLSIFGQEGEVKMQSAASLPAEADVLGQGAPEEAQSEPAPEPMAAAPAAPQPQAAAPMPEPAPAAPADDLEKLLSEISATPAPAPAPVASPPAPPPAPVAAPAPEMVPLSVASDVADLQIALPAEVLAAALRPMVQTWLQQNLAGVVERLVQAEISKLASEE